MDETLPLLELLYFGMAAPALSDAGHGRFELHALGSVDELPAALDRQACDAVVLSLSEPGALTQLERWPGLSRAVQGSALLVVAPQPDTDTVLRLLQLGVQDVLPQAQASAGALALALRLAVERKRLADASRKARSTDLATGLPDRAQLMEHTSQLLALREREPAPMALLVLRIEGLAAVDARLGVEGAQVLRRKLAVRLRSGLRASDVVATVGVDMFGVLLARIADAASADRVAVKLARALQRPFSVGGQDIAVALALGVAQFPLHGLDADVLLRHALAQLDLRVAVGRSGLVPQRGTPAANDE